jgi:indolepyruvate ferredoxin oxidoreductase
VKVRSAEARIGMGDVLTRAVARHLSKLMAYKDEYEVARLYANGDFEKRLNDTFEGEFTVKYNLAPPLLAKRDAQGRLVKSQYGGWMGPAFRWLARFRRLRGSFLDPFGRTAERRMERGLIRDYEALINEIAGALSKENHEVAVALASLPERIRGFGHVKQRNVEAVAAEREALLARFRALAAGVEHAA